jgi:CubicO group peptidase (beta-lactamase class C family)
MIAKKLTILLASLFSMTIFLVGCDGSGTGGGSISVQTTEPLPEYDFSAIDTRFQQFLDESDVYDGISYTLVDAEQGVVHEAAMGDHTINIVVLLASASKVPAVTLLMALDDDDDLVFDVETMIDNYLPWQGVYGDRTVLQLLSNTSGIPGLTNFATLGPNGPHACQADPDATLEACTETIYTTELAGSVPPGTRFDYGGSPWQLAGGVAEQVSNNSWRQAFDEYIAGPCDMEVMQFGNPGVDWGVLGIDTSTWNGHPDSLTGLDNPSIESGAISNMRDYRRLLLMHLRGGKCGELSVISPASVAFMQADRSADLPGNIEGFSYGMGWWLPENMPGVVIDFGLFGSVGWLDTERGIGGYVATDDYGYTLLDALQDPLAPPARLVVEEIIGLQQKLVDEARAKLNN